MLIDSHSHIDSPCFQKDIDGIFSRMCENKVRAALIAGCSLNEYERGLSFVNQHSNTWYSVGVHPSTTDDTHEATADELVELSKPEKVVAIGECGLDFYYDDVEPSVQEKRFLTHIEAALKADLPLIVHSRDAKEKTIELLKEGGKNLKFVLHCFTGDNQMAQDALELGGYISFSGIVTFKNAAQIQEVAGWAPKDRILIETDCPYLAPIPYRGKQNEPSYVRFVAQKLAELRNCSVEEIAECTSLNFFRLFTKAKL